MTGSSRGEGSDGRAPTAYGLAGISAPLGGQDLAVLVAGCDAAK
jgi:hypothetical protein